ncbi:hypothetical protein D3C77_587810 [compost metagenome]
MVILGVQADAVHAAVELEPDGERLVHLGLFDGFQLPQRVHHAPQVVLGDQCQFAGFEKTFQQQYRGFDTGGAQFQCLLDAGHRKAVGLGLQGQGAAHGAVAVGVGLDHGEGFGTRQFTGQTVVVAQGLEVDQGAGGTHGGCLMVVRVEIGVGFFAAEAAPTGDHKMSGNIRSLWERL